MMILRVFLTSFLCLSIQAAAMSRPADQVEIVEDSDQPDMDEFPAWVGPGWYGGVYISNENEYWNHYNQHYNNRPNDRQGDRQNGTQQRGGEQRGGGQGGRAGGGGGGHR